MIGTVRGMMRSKKEVAGLPAPIASFRSNASGVKLDSLKVLVEAVQSGSGTPSPDNVRPITGWSGANVTRTGKNVWNEQAESGSIIPATGVDVANANKIRSVGFIPVKPNTTYNIVFADTTAGSDYLYYYKKDGTFINSESYVHTASGNKTFTTPADCYNLRFIMSLTEYNNKISVNYPSTDTAYHAYNGNTYTIAFGDTYYGGELDVTNGVLRAKTQLFDLSSVETWSISSSWGDSTTTVFYSPVYSNIKYPNYDYMSFIKCNQLIPSTRNEVYVKDGKERCGVSGAVNNAQITVRILSSRASTTSAFATWLTNNPTYAEFELATPFTVQLSPQQIEQLEENNIWADTGDVSECKYSDRVVTVLFSKG